MTGTICYMPAKHSGGDPAACREAVATRIITADLAAIFAGSRGQRVRLRGEAQARPAVLPAGSGGAGRLPQAQAGVTWQTASGWERASPEYPHVPTSASPPNHVMDWRDCRLRKVPRWLLRSHPQVLRVDRSPGENTHSGGIQAPLGHSSQDLG